MIGAELYLVSFLCLAGWGGHDSCIVHQAVQSGFSGGEFASRCGDGGEGGEVEGEIGDVGIRVGFLEVCDSCFAFAWGAGGQIDVGGGMCSDLIDGFVA